jgi:hypothetical protein
MSLPTVSPSISFTFIHQNSRREFQTKNNWNATSDSPRVLVDESFEDSSELLLLAARELRSGFEKLFHLAGWTSEAN